MIETAMIFGIALVVVLTIALLPEIKARLSSKQSPAKDCRDEMRDFGQWLCEGMEMKRNVSIEQVDEFLQSKKKA